MYRHVSLIYNKRSTTLFEIIVATVIFSLVMAGMVSVFVAGKRHVLHARDRMTSGEMVKLFIEPLQLAVRQDTWDTAANALSVGNHSGGAAQNINNVPYTAQYNVTDLGAGTNVRKVMATITWTESSP